MAPIQVKVGDPKSIDDGGLTVNSDIQQTIHVLDNNYAKYEQFSQLLEEVTDHNKAPKKIIIFCATKSGVDQLERSLKSDAHITSRVTFEARGIHGDKVQYQRDEIYRLFKMPLSQTTRMVMTMSTQSKKIFMSNILLATDVASRGLDVKDIDIVINYDMPNCIEDYVHRIGRTGRAGAKGIAHSFFTRKEANLAAELIKILKKSDQEVPNKLLDLKGDAHGMNGQSKYRKWRKTDNMGKFDGGSVRSQQLSFGGPPRQDFGHNGGGNRLEYEQPRQDRQFVPKRDQKYNDKADQRNYNSGGGGTYVTATRTYREKSSNQQDLRNELFGSNPNPPRQGGPKYGNLDRFD